MKNLQPETVTLLRMAQATASPELAAEIGLLLADCPMIKEFPSPALGKAFHQLVSHGGTVLVNPPAPESPVPSESALDRELKAQAAVEHPQEYQVPCQCPGCREPRRFGGKSYLETLAEREQQERDHPPSVEPHP